jgi:type I restriction enzyme S subunit
MEIELKKLGEITTGNTPSKKDGSYWDSEDICFVKPDRIADEGITLINDSSEYISENARSKARVVSKDAVFVTCIGSIGKIGIASSGDYAFNQQINVIEPNEKVLPRYLAYNLLYSKPRLEAIANAPVVPIINKTQFGDFKLNIEEDRAKQAEIVSVLDKLTGIIEYRKIELESFDELIKARFVEAFGNPVTNDKGWSTDSCKNLMKKIGSGATPKGGREGYCDEGISLIRSMNVYNNRFEYKDLAHITDEQAEQLDNVTIEKSDVLLNITGASVARCCVVPDDLLPARVNQHVSIIRCKENLLPEFVCSMFTEDNYQRLLWNIATAGGATREAITKQQIEDLQLIVPPLDLQKQFMEFVNQVDKSKVAVQKSLDETQLLFNSLMQKYFG